MKARIHRLLPWAVLAASYLFVIGVYALIGEYNINADISSEMVLADLLNREGGFFSDNWYYSTELRVVSPVPVYQLALRLFPNNWHMARTLSLAILLAAFAAAMVYMGRGAGHARAAAYAAAAAMLPVSEVHRFLFAGGGFYTAYVILACVLIGMVLRLPRAKHRHILLVQLAILSLLGGLTGVRMPMICGVPLLLACLLDAWDALREADTLPDALRDSRAYPALGAGVSLLGMFAGYVVNAKVLAQIYHFDSYGDMQISALSLQSFGDQARYLIGFFGLNEGIPLLSAGGIVDMLTVCVCALMAIAVFTLMKRRAQLAQGERLLAYFAVFAVAFGMFLNVVTGVTENRYAVGYYLMGTFMLVVLAMLLFETMRCRMAWLRTAGMLAVVGVFFLQSAAFVRSYMYKTESEHGEAARWLVENGYENGFATFWNGNILTELSDGELEVYLYGAWNEPELTAWLQEVDHLERQPEGRVFVFVGNVEYYEGDIPCAREENLVHITEHGSRIYAYDSAQQVLALQRGQGMN